MVLPPDVQISYTEKKEDRLHIADNIYISRENIIDIFSPVAYSDLKR